MSQVGIVLVSHSHKIAEGVKDLVTQVFKETAVVAAGGTDDNEIGTSLEKIQQAIDEADQGDGVVVFFDIGSAMMNAELAIELSGSEDRVKIADAPFVEGAYVACLEAGTGKDVYEVLAAAERARGHQKKA
ncbi:dihydroxyacetone kinase phosphoryl donor subunit DhaM [Planococcus lenghuensis]|uniref:phosphoenolpyruvate--glycerone phosphotransferase n=1 Tax=Planococcus lenghuensis TaxID=2213202 RepID=A0A1Q2L4S0_9BACL|nr:dihydroxyacetone kinase phosphoryl donor subunit DhaM [Planococcus lenghuensis]AQQ54872.1 hypothetical protein B0X71_18370 [Planococcus lenghuensis]